MTNPVVILGAGGHATVVADALLCAGVRVLGFTDSDKSREGTLLCGLPILGPDDVLMGRDKRSIDLVNGIGGSGRFSEHPLRRELQQRMTANGWRFRGVRHPSAVVSSFAGLHSTAQCLALSVVQAGATLGEGVIVNTAAVVEHDVSVQEWVHVAPGAIICGGVTIGSGSHIGAGAVVRQAVRLGAGVVVAAGAVVVTSFAAAALLVGVPARAVSLSSSAAGCPPRPPVSSDQVVDE